MPVFDEQAILPYDPDVLFHTVADVANAPYWHWWFHDVQELSAGEIGVGSRWRVIYQFFGKSMPHDFELTHYELNQFLSFRGDRVMGIEPIFSFRFSPRESGTHIHFVVQPNMNLLLSAFFRWIAVPYGKLEMRRYFHSLEAQMARTAAPHPNQKKAHNT